MIVGAVEVSSPLWLAPLAGITVASLRRFHRTLGAGLVHTEMVSALGLRYASKKTRNLLDGDDEERPVCLQLFASQPADLLEGARIALACRSFEAIEINMACPMPKVTKKGSGSALLADPQKAVACVEVLKSALGTLPVWVKLRLTPGEIYPMDTDTLCRAFLENGADFLIVHGRTPAQRYEGTADKDEVVRLARCFPGKIGASGDVYAPEDAHYYLAGGCAAVVAARGILRDVLLIPRTLAFLGLREECSWDAEAQTDALIDLGERMVAQEGESLAVVLLRRMLAGLFKGFAGAGQLRREAATAPNWESLRSVLQVFKNEGAGSLLPAQYGRSP